MQELREQGARVSRSSIYRFLTELSPQSAKREQSYRKAKQAGPRPVLSLTTLKKRKLGPRHVALLFSLRPEQLRSWQAEYIEQLCLADATIATTYRQVQAFASMLGERRGADLGEWVVEVKARGVDSLQSFVRGLNNDWEAVVARLSLSYSQGQVEGQITRLKYLKRQGYGWASIALLEKRVLQRSA
jgi:transposase